jgi:hypothetical protein
VIDDHFSNGIDRRRIKYVPIRQAEWIIGARGATAGSLIDYLVCAAKEVARISRKAFLKPQPLVSRDRCGATALVCGSGPPSRPARR